MKKQRPGIKYLEPADKVNPETEDFELLWRRFAKLIANKS